MKRRFLILFMGLALGASVVAGTAGCGGADVALGQTTEQQAAGSTPTAGASDTTIATLADSSTTVAATEAQAVDYDSDDENAAWGASDASQITLAGASARVDGTGATADGSTVTITAAGTYVISGTLDDGQIVVDSAEDGVVHLVLNGAAIICSDNAPIYVKNADKTVITLAEGTDNTVTDGATYVLEDTESGEPNAAIFSKDDLTINGTGSLTVTANYNEGISSRDDLKIVGGAITIDAVGDGVQGKDSVGVKAGTITITSGGDGLQATNDQDTEKGYIAIEGGTFVITSGTDAIQAATTLAVSGGDFTITSGGGSANSSQQAGQAGNTWGDWGDGAPGTAAADASATDTTATDTTSSAKALKAATGVFVTGGNLNIDSSDDAIHSNGNVTISGGTVQISSGDDGIHADNELTIAGGEISIAQSYEGLEGAAITVNDGTIHVVSSDDGFNVAGGADSSSTNGRPGQNDFASNPNNILTITGGYIYVDAGGDGLDSNGSATMTGGTAIVNGPVETMNGALDADPFTVTGGYLVAVGSSGMATAPGSDSTQYSLMVNLDQAQQAGTIVHIESEDGQSVLTFAPNKQFQSVVLSSADLKKGVTYVVYLGGTATGTITDGVYSGGAYTPGTQDVSLTLDSVVTTAGATGGFGGGRGPGH
jgi:hypothetical protein